MIIHELITLKKAYVFDCQYSEYYSFIRNFKITDISNKTNSKLLKNIVEKYVFIVLNN